MKDHPRKPNHLTFKQREVIHAEREHLNKWVEKGELIHDENTGWGIAISGGGIRSASFGLGVLQGLVRDDLLKKFHYLSTVSGGGYLGSALTWALYQGKGMHTTEKDKFPLGKKGMHRVQDVNSKNRQHKGMDNDLLDFIRLHGSYLTPTAKLDIVSFIAVVLRSSFMSLLVYFSFLTVLMTGALWFIYFVYNHFLKDNIPHSLLPFMGFTSSDGINKGLMLWVGIIILAIIIFKGLVYSLGTFFGNKKVPLSSYADFVNGQISIGLMLKISLTCFLFGSLPYFVDWTQQFIPYIAGSSTLFGTLVGLWQYNKAHKNEKNSGASSDLLIYAGAFALLYGILLFAYLCATQFILNPANGPLPYEMAHPRLYFALIVLSLVFGWIVNLNRLGPHHIWRNRLMEAFMPDKKAVDEKKWQRATKADTALMENMCKEEYNYKPYHIINTNIILAKSSKVEYSGRGGDNFIISPLFCGSHATGWKSTKNFQKHNSRGITLATAMATSAAALNPNAGVSGEGVTRNTAISVLLSFLNLRLGYWTINPGAGSRAERFLGTPNFFIPGLSSEIFRTGLTETSPNIQLSDGGHYENLGLYELIRRKLSLIVVSDGGADPNFNFDDLSNAIEKVRVDFGVKINFRYPDSNLDAILPGTALKNEINMDYNKKYNIAKNGFAIADIYYEGDDEKEGKNGKLIYLKLAMIEDLPTDVNSYKGVHPDFPHQSTSDQFFDEKQFEAYRELGYRITKQMLSSNIGSDIFL